MHRSGLGAAIAIASAVLAAATVPSLAPAQVDPSGPWRTLHTSHFRVHFRPDYRAVAHRAANEAERAWALLAAELPPPRGRIDLTLSDDADIANGFATPVPTNRFTVFLTPPADEPSLQHYDSWLRIVIVHELAHLFHLDRAGGIWGLLQRVFGRAPGLFPNAYQPSWMVEGVATYYESRFSNAGRVNGPLHLELLAAQAADSASRSPWNAVNYARWPGGLTSYAYGSQFLASAAAASGDSLVPRFVAATSRQLIPFRVGRPYARVSGRRLAEDWSAGTQPAPAGVIAGERLVTRLRQPPRPRVSPDGHRLAYLHDDGRDAPELRIVRRAGWRIERTQRVNGEVSYDWLGDTLVVAQLDFTDRRQVRSDLYSWLPDGVWRRDTEGRRITQPRAGGGVLATIALTSAGQVPSVGGAALTDTAGVTWGAIAPSPDGRMVVAARHRDGHWSLVRWPTAHPDSAVELLSTNDVISDPTWDGRGRVYFVMPVSGFSQVHVWDEHGPRTVTDAPLGAREPTAEPLGAFLYSTLSGEGWELRRSESLDGSAPAVEPPAPFREAATVATRESRYTWLPSTLPRYWLPLYADAGAAGRFFGITTAGNDPVGRLAYRATVLSSPNPFRLAAGFGLAHDALGNPTFDASVSNDWSLVGVTTTGIAVSEVSYDGALGVTVASRRWRRSLSFRVALEAEGRRFRTEPLAVLSTVCTGCDAGDFVGGSVILRGAHLVTPALGVSAQDGITWSAFYRRREAQGDASWSGELQLRVAAYARLPRVSFAHPVLAVRVATGLTHGPSPQSYGVGGLSSTVLDAGFGFVLGTARSFPVRGYEPSAMRGRRAFAATAELRWPLALIGRSFGHLPAGLDKLWLTLFADAGDAWDAGSAFHPSHLIGVGAEAVAELRISYDVPLRGRLGVAAPIGSQALTRPARLTAYAALGADF